MALIAADINAESFCWQQHSGRYNPHLPHLLGSWSPPIPLWRQLDINPFTATACEMPDPGWKVHTYAPANSIFDGPITDLLSTLCILIEVLSCVCVKGRKGLNGFRFGTFVGRFLSDGATGMAVKGLNKFNQRPSTFCIVFHFEDVPQVEFIYLVFTCMPGEFCRWPRSLLSYLCYVFQALINSLLCRVAFWAFFFFLTSLCVHFWCLLQVGRFKHGWSWEEQGDWKSPCSGEP